MKNKQIIERLEDIRNSTMGCKLCVDSMFGWFPKMQKYVAAIERFKIELQQEINKKNQHE